MFLSDGSNVNILSIRTFYVELKINRVILLDKIQYN